MAINNKHNDYIEMMAQIELVKDCCEGESEIKEHSDLYLPKPDGMTQISYKGYLTRASFVNYTGKVLSNAVAQLFRTKPVIKDFPIELENDIDGRGRTLSAFSRSVANELIQSNRAAVVVDWNESTQMPYLTMYEAENIINWRVQDNKLSLIVIEGEVEKVNPDDIYDTICVDTWRELYLDENGLYAVRDWEEYKDKVTNKVSYKITNEYQPIMNDQPLDYIPLFFVTSLGDTTEVLKPSLYDLACVNLGHYHNSADYENMLHWCGCRTIVTTGLGDAVFPIGGVVDLPAGGSAVYLEARSDSALATELSHKEQIMAQLGSGIISGKGRYVASAETAKISSDGEYASLADMATALSEVMTNVIQLMDNWMNNKDDSTSMIEYNTIYSMDAIQPAELLAYITAVEKGYISMPVFMAILESKGIYPADYDIETEKQLLIAKQAQMTQSVTQ